MWGKVGYFLFCKFIKWYVVGNLLVMQGMQKLKMLNFADKCDTCFSVNNFFFKVYNIVLYFNWKKIDKDCELFLIYVLIKTSWTANSVYLLIGDKINCYNFEWKLFAMVHINCTIDIWVDTFNEVWKHLLDTKYDIAANVFYTTLNI